MSEVDHHYLQCKRCLKNLSHTSLFCSSCGAVQIHNSLIYEKTTANYDPGDRNVRPWREISVLASNHWSKYPNSRKVCVSAEPWRPNGAVKRHYAKGCPPTIQSKIENSMSSSLTENVSATQDLKKPLKIDRTGVFYQGRLWKRAGYKEKTRRCATVNIHERNELFVDDTGK